MLKKPVGRWVMKELIGSGKDKPCLPQKEAVNKAEIFQEASIADKFNRFFRKIGPALASKIP